MKNINYLLILFANLVFSQHKMVILKGFDNPEQSNKTIEEVNVAYQIIKNAPITFDNNKEKLNNCENRAQFAYYILKHLGFEPINYWVFKEGLVEDKYDTQQKVNNSIGICYTPIGKSKPIGCWRYHVAAGVIIKDEKNNEDVYIFDPWTQGELVKLEDWSISFFRKTETRTAYVLSVSDSYEYFGQTTFGKLSLNKADWKNPITNDYNQMFCGLEGITPNDKCNKNRFQERIQKKKTEIIKYLKENSIPFLE